MSFLARIRKILVIWESRIGAKNIWHKFSFYTISTKEEYFRRNAMNIIFERRFHVNFNLLTNKLCVRFITFAKFARFAKLVLLGLLRVVTNQWGLTRPSSILFSLGKVGDNVHRNCHRNSGLWRGNGYFFFYHFKFDHC